MSKPKRMEVEEAEVLQACREFLEKQGLADENVIREVEVNDGAGNIYCFRLWAWVVGVPSYRLEIVPGGSMGLGDDGIRELARFFTWLEEHATAKRFKLSTRYGKIRARVLRDLGESG